MNEHDARRAVQLADERAAILGELKLLADENRAMGEGLGIVLVTMHGPPIGAAVCGATAPELLGLMARRMTAQVPREAYDAARMAVVESAGQRVRVIEDEMRAIGVEP